LPAWVDHGSHGGGGDVGLNSPTQGDWLEISLGGMVWSARELYDALVTLIDVGDGSLAVEDMVRWTRIGVVAVEMEGQMSPHSVICAIFEIGGGRAGNKFVRSGDRVL
jgi:hypothetical protein